MANIYNKKHSIIITSDKDKRKVNVKVEIESSNIGVSNKELYIRLTDSDSMSFLFCLKINDDNFQELKNQQGLLVDLSAFGQKLIDLLEMCLSEESSDYPKYLLKLCGNGDIENASLSCANWTLNFIETNPFKHLTHLSLRFCAGDAEQFRNYLIDCLKNSRIENKSLSTRLEQTESTLRSKLSEMQTNFSDSRQQLVNLQTSSRIELEELRSKLEQQTLSSREKLLETESYWRSKLDQEKRDADSNCVAAVRIADGKIDNLERTNRCLCDENSKLESDIKEMKLRCESSEESLKRSHQEIQSLRRSVEQHEKHCHELECQMQKMSTRIAVLEQEVRDKDQMLLRTQELYASEQDHKNRLMEENQKKNVKIDKLEKAVKSMNEEVSKGNEIIQKLQSEIKHCHSKIKVRTQITAEQEKVLGERESALTRITGDMENLRKELAKKEEELEKTSFNLEQSNKKLEESNHIIKTNENVINWLNRQVTEYELTKQKPGFAGLSSRQSQQGTTYSTCTDSTIKYRPISTSSGVSNGDQSHTNPVLTGIVNRGKLLPGSGTGPVGSTQTSQAAFNNQNVSSKIDSLTNSSSAPLSSTVDKISVSNQRFHGDQKYSAISSVGLQSTLSTDRTNWNKFPVPHSQPTRNPPTSAVLSIPEEQEPTNSIHQQSLSSAYFPKALLGGPR